MFGSLFCPFLLLLIKFWWREGTLWFTISPTHSMLLFKGCGFERERENFSGTTQIWYAHRMKVVLHKLVAWSWSLVILYCILPCPVHDNRPKKTTASEFKEVYNIPYTSMAKNKRKTHVSKQYHNSSNNVQHFLSIYKFDCSLFTFLTVENQFSSQYLNLLMSKFWNEK